MFQKLKSLYSFICNQFYVGKGNNATLLKTILNKRPNWQPTDEYNLNFNFKWLQSNKRIYYCLLSNKDNHIRVVNHFENEQLLTNKRNMIYTLGLYCQRIGKQLFDIIPPTIVINTNQKLNLAAFKTVFGQLATLKFTPELYGSLFETESKHLIRRFAFEQNEFNV